MILHAAFLSFSLAISTPTGQQGGGKLPDSQAAQKPTVVFPQPVQDSPPSVDFMGWHGWNYLQGAPAVWPKLYEYAGDWSDIQAHYDAGKAAKPSLWRLKVVIFSRTESDGRDSQGVLREHRGSIESVQLGQIQDAVRRFQAYVDAKFDDAVEIVADVSVETEWMRDAEPAPFGPEFSRSYFEGRINGGSYEAEDKVFRGPFDSAVFIVPGAISTPIPDTIVNETPVAGIPALPLDSHGLSVGFDIALRNAWWRQVELRAKQQGFKGVEVSTSAPQSPESWHTAVDLDEQSPQALLAHLQTSLLIHSGVADPTVVKLAKLPETEVKIATDTDRGQVLEVKETTGYRAGGVTLPARADGMPFEKVSSAPTLSFYAKSVSKDPMALRLDSSDGHTAWVSLGRDPVLVSPMLGVKVLSVPFVADGKWRQITVDLKPLATDAGLTDIVRMAVEPTPNAKIVGKLQPDPVDYEFDEFKFSSDAAGPVVAPIAPDPASEDPEARALFASQAKVAGPELAALLKDKNVLVRLNATDAYTRLKDPSVETALISNSLDLDPTVAGTALKALMVDGSDTAISVVRRSVSVSLSDYAKMIAAKLLADTKDPKMAADISLLLDNRSWQARTMGAEALAEIATSESQNIRLAFLILEEPSAKLAVTRHADPNEPEVIKKLEWSAVNEPSDMVRAESYIKLVQANLPAVRAEGYKGVRDDSKFVRILLLQYLAAHPVEENRNALRVAIADKSASVRSEAIRGFAALDMGATADEIANVLDDQNSDVQLALIELSKKRGLKLPQKTIDGMKSSGDPRVAAAAKELEQKAA